jgi:hypothetical protein
MISIENGFVHGKGVHDARLRYDQRPYAQESIIFDTHLFSDQDRDRPGCRYW